MNLGGGHVPDQSTLSRRETAAAVKIEPGEVAGHAPLRRDPAEANTILVKEGERGVQETPLRPGTY